MPTFQHIPDDHKFWICLDSKDDQTFTLIYRYGTGVYVKDVRITFKDTIFYGIRNSRPFLPWYVAVEKRVWFSNPVKKM